MASEIDEVPAIHGGHLIRGMGKQEAPVKGRYPSVCCRTEGAVEVGRGAYCHFCHADPVALLCAATNSLHPCGREAKVPRPGGFVKTRNKRAHAAP